MLINKIDKYYNTAKHLKWIQIKYQIYYRLRRMIFGRYKPKVKETKVLKTKPVIEKFRIYNHQSYLGSKKFSFLNIEHAFDQIDWQIQDYGMLWNYNLNYFDYLNQKQIGIKDGLALIEIFIENEIVSDHKVN